MYKESIGNSISGLDNNLLIKKEIDGWILFLKEVVVMKVIIQNFTEDIVLLIEVKPPYKIDFSSIT